MKLARLSLAGFAILSLIACSTDAMGPMQEIGAVEGPSGKVSSPSGPRFSGGFLGTGSSEPSDSTSPPIESTDTVDSTITPQ